MIFAVPFFFAVYGYFYAGKLSSGHHPVWPYLKRLLTVFLSWFLIYLTVDLIQHGMDSPLSFLLNAVKGIGFRIAPSHFWYFPALIYCVCLLTLLNKWRLHRLFLPMVLGFCFLGILGGSLLAVGQKIPLLNRLYLHPDYDLLRKYGLMAPSYFGVGVIVNQMEKRFFSISSKKLLLLWLFSCILWAAEMRQG